MSEKQTPESASSLSEADQQRFENDLLPWLAGQLSADQADWMHQTQQRHAHLAHEVAWLGDFKTVVRQEAQDENTDAAWAKLAHRLAAPAQQQAPGAVHVPRPWLLRWLHWLLGHPGWAHTGAALVVVLVLGQAVWIAGMPQQAPEPAWRSLDMDALQAAPAPAVRVQIQLRAGSLGTDMAAIAAVADRAEAQWQAQPDGRWILTVAPALPDAQALLARLQAQPAVVQAQLLP